MTEIVVWSLILVSTLVTGGAFFWLGLRFSILERSRVLERIPASLRTATHFLGVLVCTLLVAGLIEASLRLLFKDRYFHLAHSSFEPHATLIHAPISDHRTVLYHPDTGIPHPVLHNSGGQRQHRILGRDDTSGSTLAFFGDSYTANLRMPVSYSFTEVLDYLLREDEDDARVWNLGVDSYGTDQAYLRYHELPDRDQFEYVFYVFSQNDLRNIRGNRLVRIDPNSGELEFSSFAGSSLATRLISSTYLLYWVLDMRRSVLGVQNRGSPQEVSYDKEELVFLRLLERWRDEVDEAGGHFAIVLPQYIDEAEFRRLVGEGWSVISLRNETKTLAPQVESSDLRFRNNGHWNELANQYAAIGLYRAVAPKFLPSPASDSEIAQRLATYYASFPGDAPDPSWATGGEGFPAENESIRHRYLELEAEP